MSSGVIMTIIFLVIISVMTLATAGNGLPAINGAKIAGKFAFDIIDHVPGV